MTTPSTERKAGPLLGTGSQTTWPFTFKVFAATDIAVTIADSLGVETQLTFGVDYTVTLNSNQETSPGGTVTYPISGSPLPVGSRLVIVGNLPYDQPLDLPSGGNFSPLALENQLDRLTMQIQQLREQLGRALQVSRTTGANVRLPAPNANQIIGWDASGNNLQNVPLESLATAVAFATMRYDTFTGDGAETQFQLSADPAVIGNLDVAVGGVTQIPGTDYTLTSSTLVFSSPPPLGVTILARYGEALPPGQSVGANDVSYLPAGAGAVPRTVENKLRDVFDVRDFGAVGDGLTDDTVAIQTAINAASFAFAKVTSPAGYTYRITDTLIIDRDRIILDFNRSGLLLDDTSGVKDHLKFGNGTIQRNQIYVQNVIFGRAQAATAGYAVNFDRIGLGYIRNCLVFGDNKVHGGFSVKNGIMIYIEGNEISRCVNYGIYLFGSDPIDRTIDVVIRENRIDYNYNGIQIWDCVEGVFCRDNIIFGQTNNALNVDASDPTRGLVSFKFQENDFDGSVGTGVFLDKVTNVQFTDNWYSSNGFNNGVASNMYVGPDASGVIIDGNQFYNASLDTSNSLRVDGPDCVISSNLLNGGGGTGILIQGTLAAITGNSLKFHLVGINAFSANKYSVVGNLFEGVTTPLGVSGASDEIVIANNGGVCVGSKTYDPPSVPAGGTDTTTVSVHGADFGDIVSVGFTNHNSNGSMIIYGYVSATDTVTVVFRNPTGSAIDLPSGGLHVIATKARKY